MQNALLVPCHQKQVKTLVGYAVAWRFENLLCAVLTPCFSWVAIVTKIIKIKIIN